MIDLHRGILELFVDAHFVPQTFFDMDGFCLIGEEITDERKADKKRFAERKLHAERAAIACTECGTLLNPPLKRGRRPTTCGGRCRLQRLYKMRRAS